MNGYNLYQVEQAAKKKDNQIFLINGIIKLVFTSEELAASCGLGLKSSKISGEAKSSPLDPTKVQAVKGKYSMLYALKSICHFEQGRLQAYT